MWLFKLKLINIKSNQKFFSRPSRISKGLSSHVWPVGIELGDVGTEHVHDPGSSPRQFTRFVWAARENARFILAAASLVQAWSEWGHTWPCLPSLKSRCWGCNTPWAPRPNSCAWC